MTWTFAALDGSDRRNPHLYGTSGEELGEHVQAAQHEIWGGVGIGGEGVFGHQNQSRLNMLWETEAYGT